MKLMPDIKIPAQSRSVFIDTIDYLADEQACLRAAQPLMWQKQPGLYNTPITAKGPEAQ